MAGYLVSDSLIGFDVRGLDAVQKLLHDLIEPSIADEAAEAAADYVIDVLQQYPPQQSIPRAQAYPEVGGWFSERQRRWFFAALNSGELSLPYSRTQALRNSWQKVGNGSNLIVVNETEYAVFVMGDSQGNGQSRQQMQGGWDTLPYIIRERQARITEIVEGLVKRRTK